VEKSYLIIPADVFLPSVFMNLQAPFWAKTVSLLNVVAALSIQLAGPGMVSILMTEVFLGVANRLAPQVQISFLGMSLKSFVGVGVVWIGLFFIFNQFTKQTLDWITMMDNLIESVVPYRNL
jgi:type III secretion protein T